MSLATSYLLSFLLILIPFHAQADLYKKVDDKGRVFFTDSPEGHGYRLIMRTPKKGTVEYKNFMQNRRKLAPLIQRQARELKVDPALVMAVIHAESAYDKNAISRAGAVGLMQLMPATAKRFGVTNRNDAAQNIRGGVRYLRHLLEKFKFNIKLTLAAYNAGESAVKKYGNKIPPYPETQNYVKKVISYYEHYLSGKTIF
ncbi:MAG: lytic transglycosylase [Cycloclasticus sp. symbiont of Bathymodiolus heckerae]|nr:MAG: lytic transglycosylase [Cycloclasticus sp. symbiont of Bathymodiolus heckerae]